MGECKECRHVHSWADWFDGKIEAKFEQHRDDTGHTNFAIRMVLLPNDKTLDLVRGPKFGPPVPRTILRRRSLRGVPTGRYRVGAHV